MARDVDARRRERALPVEAYLLALASLDVGYRKLRALVDRHPPERAWQRVVAGDELTPAARRQAVALDPAAVWRAHCAAGIGVTAPGSPSFPAVFVDDPEPPIVLVHRGDLDSLSGPRVAIVGTRRCTRYGREVAHELGAGLSAAGVSIVSGLALGIDAAAHDGALMGGAPPIGVPGCGLDIVYPAANAALWRAVGERGVLVGEVALGGPPIGWRFPARNRIIAALADVVVVVESHDRGGSLSTVTEAVRRDRQVLAVPGPVRSPASSGTNRLLADGCAPACGVDDVLIALGLSPGRRRRSRERRARPSRDGRRVLDALGWVPATLDQLAIRSGLALDELSGALDELVAHGWAQERNGWFERIGREQAVVAMHGPEHGAAATDGPEHEVVATARPEPRVAGDA